MAGVPKWVPSAPGLKEDPESGEKVFADRQTFTQIYNGKYADCDAAVVPKGTIGSGATTGYIVQSCRLTKSRGEIGRLVLIWEGFTGSVLPADEFGLNPQDLNPAVEKNPAFDAVTTTQLEKIRAAVFTADEVSAAAASAWIAALGAGTGEAETKDLFALLKRGVTNYYKPFFTYWWAQHYSTEPSVNTGSYIEAPGGPLASTISGLGLSSLRQADDLQYTGGIYRRVRKWMCAADSYWPTVLY